MFAVIHDGITVKDKDGNVYPGDGQQREFDCVTGNMLCRYEKYGVKHYECLPILEHGQRYLVKKDGEEFVARFDADTFEFQGPSWWLVSECQGFAPIPQIIEI